MDLYTYLYMYLCTYLYMYMYPCAYIYTHHTRTQLEERGKICVEFQKVRAWVEGTCILAFVCITHHIYIYINTQVEERGKIYDECQKVRAWVEGEVAKHKSSTKTSALGVTSADIAGRRKDLEVCLCVSMYVCVCVCMYMYVCECE
jgi:hypothetical protein